jgi:hypothetical protein
MKRYTALLAQIRFHREFRFPEEISATPSEGAMTVEVAIASLSAFNSGFGRGRSISGGYDTP